MALAFLVLVVARTTTPSTPGSPAPLASAGAVGGSSPTPDQSSGTVGSPTAGPSGSQSPLPSTAPTSSPSTAPAPSGTPASTSAPNGQTYTVQPGDTLSLIAAKFGTTVKAIAAANNIADPRIIHVGQVLIIP
jgi:putative chitinase